MCLVCLKSLKHKIKVDKTSQKNNISSSDELLIICYIIHFIDKFNRGLFILIKKEPINDIIDLLY